MVFDLAGLLRSLVDGDVRFILIGGVAVAAHQVVRSTEDVDIVPDSDPDNLMRLGNVLVTLDARILGDPQREIDPTVRQALSRGRNLTLSTRLGDLDVVQRAPGMPGYAQLAAGAWETAIFDVPLRVCSREDLIAMKRARASPRDLADIADLAQLGEP